MKKIMMVLAVGLLVACGSKLTPENLAKVQTGMTESEVKGILGSPTTTESSGALGITGTVYTYKSGPNEVKVTFVNGKVFATAGSLK
jgi:hypothetical protein